MPYTFCEQIGKEARDISDEIPFDIPESWEWVRLKTICSKLVDGDHNPPKGEITQTEYLMISSTNMNNDRIENLDKVRYLSKEVFEQENLRTQASKGDIFFTSVGSLGRSCVYNGKYNFTFQRSVSVISTLIFNYYLKYCFDSGYFQVKVIKEATGTAQKGFYLNQLSESMIPIPPLAEQRRIVSKIEELLPFIDKYEQAETQLATLNTTFPEALKKSILQEAVQGKLVPQNPDDEPASVLLERIQAEKKKLVKEGKIKKDRSESVIVTRDKIPYEIIDGKERCIADEVPFELPESWCWCRLNQLGVFSSGKTPSMSEPAFWNGGIPWVSSKDMKKSIIADSEMHITDLAAESMQLYPKGTLLLVARSGILRRLLPLCVLGVDSTINQDIKAFMLYDSSLSTWLYYAIKAFEPYILKELVKSITTVESLKFDEFSSMLIPIPPLVEQERIIGSIKASIKLLSPLVQDSMFMI